MRKFCLIFLCCAIGCDAKINWGTNTVPLQPDQKVVVVSAGVAFDNYKKSIASNYRILANRIDADEFEYVAQLVDAYKLLDAVSKRECGDPINQRMGEALGSDKLDKVVAGKLLRTLADELDGGK